ncbi:hypothetical protein [Halorubrum vacuolatum]|uniref:Uncharacterized protein n=1 Tax=Halorubrum vacuolatum TaxID=63740 RepID=A0A238V7V6_HALVU|nr:hypothetical protein [Halorubrum vacuolatum]SNR30532.1 hypothetical protein SAMN06264855_10275 [Halorubrum vacuolatum]
MVHDPLSPSEAVRTPVGAVAGISSAFILLYSLVIMSQILIGLAFAGVLTAGAYLCYRVLAVLDSIADAAQRVAAVREHEASVE